MLNITDVLFVIFAASVVLSTLFPSASFSSIPNSSMNAPLVPDPSSLEQIVISPEAAAIAVVPIVATPNNAAIATAKPFFIIHFSFSSRSLCFLPFSRLQLYLNVWM